MELSERNASPSPKSIPLCKGKETRQPQDLNSQLSEAKMLNQKELEAISRDKAGLLREFEAFRLESASTIALLDKKLEDSKVTTLAAQVSIQLHSCGFRKRCLYSN